MIEYYDTYDGMKFIIFKVEKFYNYGFIFESYEKSLHSLKNFI